ncbi:ABC transporter permease [Methylobacterium sp. E-046]|uniref:ABC transporter permease n=1 Tax=Methylobacterium sp. E-046 TaxID=2836576 RepID=UPI001FBB5A27|nr:ABC transporter permease [Methylobacterium sp. E-046]MCJ2103087.1 ABC transporter permease [Methylobacterium sp. E-046]
MADQAAFLRYERGEQRLVLLLLAPALLLVSLLLLVPLAWLIFQSVWHDGLTLENYRRIFTEEIYARSFLLTFRIAATVTALTLLLGYPVAYAAAIMHPRWRPLVLALVVLPFWVSVLVRAYAWMVLLQRRGLVNALLQGSGLIDTPLTLINNEFGTVLATVHILLPFMVLPLYATMQRIPPELMLAGATLGGSPAHVFRHVFLPLSMPGVVAGGVLVFVLALGFYITPELLGGGRTFMISMLVGRNVELYDQWGAASSISVILLACVGLLFWVASRLVPLERIMGAR